MGVAASSHVAGLMAEAKRASLRNEVGMTLNHEGEDNNDHTTAVGANHDGSGGGAGGHSGFKATFSLLFTFRGHQGGVTAIKVHPISGILHQHG